MAWVRKLQYFNNGYAFALVMIICATLFISATLIKEISLGNESPGFKPLGNNNFIDPIGFAFYGAFQGVGTLLPIMKDTRQ